MSSKVNFSLECSTAEITGEGFEACVLSGMGDQVRRLTEGLAANGAFVGFLTWKKENLF